MVRGVRPCAASGAGNDSATARYGCAGRRTDAAGVDALVVIGGDGSFTGAEVFNEEFGFPVMGIPGTIDNDIFGTSHTLGYDTALNTVVDCIDKIRDTASSHNRLFFVEVMGRDAGHIALNAGIGAGAEEILIPEEDLGLDRLLESLQKSKASGKSSSIVVVAEGDKMGKNVFELKDYIEQHYEDKITIETLASLINTGRRTFERRFKLATNNTPIEYIQRVRIEAAKLLFEASRKNVSEIMFDVGYTDTKAFRDVFKKVTGLTPIEYRNKFAKSGAEV